MHTLSYRFSLSSLVVVLSCVGVSACLTGDLEPLGTEQQAMSAVAAAPAVSASQTGSPGDFSCMEANRLGTADVEPLYAVVVDGQCLGLTGPGYAGDLMGVSWVVFNDTGLELDEKAGDRLFTAAMNGEELEVFNETVETLGLWDWFLTIIGIGHGGSDPQGCTNCAIENCTGYGGNPWFDCVCNHCRVQCMYMCDPDPR